MSDEVSQRTTTSLSFTELQAVYHSVNDAIFIYEEDGEIIDVNEAAAEMYGYSRSQLRGMTAGAISSGEPPYTDEVAREQVNRALAGESPTFEWQGKDSDGNVFWEEVSLSKTVIEGETRVIAIVRDISDKREAEQRFQTLIDNLPGVVYRCRNEPNWPMLYVGGQCEGLTGYSAGALESGDVVWGQDILHPDDRDRMEAEVDEALAAGEPFEVTYRIRRADGEVRWVWERGQEAAVPRQDGTILEGFITDMTDQKQHEQRVEAQRDNLELLNRVVRHDIRNKLQLVEIYADMVKESVSEENEEQVQNVLDAAGTAVDITKTARDVTRVMLQSGADCQPVRLRSVLEDEIDDIRSNYRGALFVVDGSIPDVDVSADEMLGSVFRNLLVNAVQHNDSDVPEVTTSVSVTDDAAVVRLADNGPGIPDDRKEKIFDQAETGLESEGTGLGLYLVETLVDRYDGSIHVEDNEPEGAAFVLELPLAEGSRR